MRGESHKPRWLLGQLWNSSDIMPRYLCDELGMERGSTYGQAAQRMAELAEV